MVADVRFMTMKHLKIQNKEGGWNLDEKIAFHLMEIDYTGGVLRVVDVDHQGHALDAAPTNQNPCGALDHPPLSQESDWSDYQISKEEFEAVWAKAQKPY